MGSVSDSATLWNAHKAFSRGLLIQLCTQTKKKMAQQINQLVNDIKHAESQSQSHPYKTLKTKLLSLRQELRALLPDSFEKHHRQLKAHHYATNNKAMALRVCGQCTKSKISHMFHPISTEKLHDPQAIANRFSCY